MVGDGESLPSTSHLKKGSHSQHQWLKKLRVDPREATTKGRQNGLVGCALTGRHDWQLPGALMGVSWGDIHLLERNP